MASKVLGNLFPFPLEILFFFLTFKLSQPNLFKTQKAHEPHRGANKCTPQGNFVPWGVLGVGLGASSSTLFETMANLSYFHKI